MATKPEKNTEPIEGKQQAAPSALGFKPSPIDFWQQLEASGVLGQALTAIEGLLARLPAGIGPTAGQIEAVFKQYVTQDVFEGLLSTAVAQLQAALVSGKGPISNDPSALA